MSLTSKKQTRYTRAITSREKVGQGMNIAYVRVSTVEQNEERQVEALKKYGIDPRVAQRADR
jgi:hypothetical protein